MARLTFVDIVDLGTFGFVPPCADPRFDHRTCDYWEDPDRGSKASRPKWLESPVVTPIVSSGTVAAATGALDGGDNPFAPLARGSSRPSRSAALAALAGGGDANDAWNPFAPVRTPVASGQGLPRKLGLLIRGRDVFGSYGKVALAADEAVAWSQFGPLSAYPRASRMRELYPHLPDSPLPAVITCIASTAAARRQGYAKELIDEVCSDLAGRGFSAVEAYPDLTQPETETSGGRPCFWAACGFRVAAPDERFPVMRRELD